MRRILNMALASVLLSGLSGLTLADEVDPKAVLDKGIKALGGEEKLGKSGCYTVKAKGTLTFNGNNNEFKTQGTVQGLDHYRSEFEGEFNGDAIKVVTVVNGDKGWRKFGDNMMELEGDGIANEKRTIYLAVLPTTLVPLKGKDFKLEAAGEEKVDDKSAVAIKVTGPDGKDFKLFFDKESGLPVKLVARVIGFGGDEFTQETTYTNYKEFDGAKKATKLSSKRDGEKFIEQEVTDFKLIDTVPADTFSEPK
jgi:hypothetical protein